MSLLAMTEATFWTNSFIKPLKFAFWPFFVIFISLITFNLKAKIRTVRVVLIFTIVLILLFLVKFTVLPPNLVINAN